MPMLKDNKFTIRVHFLPLLQKKTNIHHSTLFRPMPKKLILPGFKIIDFLLIFSTDVIFKKLNLLNLYIALFKCLTVMIVKNS